MFCFPPHSSKYFLLIESDCYVLIIITVLACECRKVFSLSVGLEITEPLARTRFVFANASDYEKYFDDDRKFNYCGMS